MQYARVFVHHLNELRLSSDGALEHEVLARFFKYLLDYLHFIPEGKLWRDLVAFLLRR